MWSVWSAASSAGHAGDARLDQAVDGGGLEAELGQHLRGVLALGRGAAPNGTSQGANGAASAAAKQAAGAAAAAAATTTTPGGQPQAAKPVMAAAGRAPALVANGSDRRGK